MTAVNYSITSIRSGWIVAKATAITPCTSITTRRSRASFIDYGEKQKHVQEVLDRCWDILDVLPASLLKLRLLTACYGEVFDEPLADEGRSIIASWDSATLTSDQQEAIVEFQNVVDNPYPWEYIDE